MSNQALSQDEIDALFGGGDSPAPEPPAPTSREPEVRLYDFRRPSRISKDRQRTLEGMYGMLAKSLEGWLAGRIRGQVEVELAGVEQLTFGEFVLSLPDPCASFLFDIGEEGGPQAVIDMGREFAFYTVERFLGSATETYVPERALTVLERRVVRIVGERVASLVQEVWRDHTPMTLSLSRFESVPEMLQAANREDPMLVANVQVRFRGESSALLVCLPFAVLDAFFATSATSRIRKPGPGDDRAGQDKPGVVTSLRRTSVPVSVRLPGFELSLREIAALKPGGTLVTGVRRDSPVEVLIGGRPRYTGHIGTMNKALAVQVHESVEPDEDEIHG